MKFTFDRDAILKEIGIAQEIISTKNALSILSNVLFIAEHNSLTIKATDIKVNFETKIPGERNRNSRSQQVHHGQFVHDHHQRQFRSIALTSNQR